MKATTAALTALFLSTAAAYANSGSNSSFWEAKHDSPLPTMRVSDDSAPDLDARFLINPIDMAVYSGSRLATGVPSPDGTIVLPFQAPVDGLGNVGVPGFGKAGINTGFYVQPGQLVQWGGTFKWISGADHQCQICVEKSPELTAVHQCIGFNGKTGAYSVWLPDSGSEIAVDRYSIFPVDGFPGWFHASITFRTADTIPANSQAFVYFQWKQGVFALGNGWTMATGQAP
jgi:hypothetical protein